MIQSTALHSERFPAILATLMVDEHRLCPPSSCKISAYWATVKLEPIPVEVIEDGVAVKLEPTPVGVIEGMPISPSTIV